MKAFIQLALALIFVSRPSIASVIRGGPIDYENLRLQALSEPIVSVSEGQGVTTTQTAYEVPVSTVSLARGVPRENFASTDAVFRTLRRQLVEKDLIDGSNTAPILESVVNEQASDLMYPTLRNGYLQDTVTRTQDFESMYQAGPELRMQSVSEPLVAVESDLVRPGVMRSRAIPAVQPVVESSRMLVANEPVISVTDGFDTTAYEAPLSTSAVVRDSALINEPVVQTLRTQRLEDNVNDGTVTIAMFESLPEERLSNTAYPTVRSEYIRADPEPIVQADSESLVVLQGDLMQPSVLQSSAVPTFQPVLESSRRLAVNEPLVSVTEGVGPANVYEVPLSASELVREPSSQTLRTQVLEEGINDGTVTVSTFESLPLEQASVLRNVAYPTVRNEYIQDNAAITRELENMYQPDASPIVLPDLASQVVLEDNMVQPGVLQSTSVPVIQSVLESSRALAANEPLVTFTQIPGGTTTQTFYEVPLSTRELLELTPQASSLNAEPIYVREIGSNYYDLENSGRLQAPLVESVLQPVVTLEDSVPLGVGDDRFLFESTVQGDSSYTRLEDEKDVIEGTNFPDRAPGYSPYIHGTPAFNHFSYGNFRYGYGIPTHSYGYQPSYYPRPFNPGYPYSLPMYQPYNYGYSGNRYGTWPSYPYASVGFGSGVGPSLSQYPASLQSPTGYGMSASGCQSGIPYQPFPIYIPSLPIEQSPPIVADQIEGPVTTTRVTVRERVYDPVVSVSDVVLADPIGRTIVESCEPTGRELGAINAILATTGRLPQAYRVLQASKYLDDQESMNIMLQTGADVCSSYKLESPAGINTWKLRHTAPAICPTLQSDIIPICAVGVF